MKMMGNYKISYAQNREDIIIAGFFPDVEKGFYIDIGANDPVDDSVTKLFYEKGWNGLNVEPSPRLYAKLARDRKRDINVNLGASNKKAKLQFREYANHGLSTFSADIMKAYEKDPTGKTATYKDYDVEVLPTRDIFSKYIKNVHVHFMKVDVEGYEYSVLAGNDWKVYRPELICIEANHILEDWHSILKDAQYELVFNDGLNEYFLRRESMHRKDLFNYAETVLLSGIVINPGIARRIMRGDEAQFQVQHYVSEVERLGRENARLKARTNGLQTEMNRAHSLRTLSRDLYSELDGRILQTIDRRGHRRKAKKRVPHEIVGIDTLTSTSKEEVLLIAKQYDVKTFFRYRAPKSTMKLRYRVASKTYRVVRDSMRKVAVKGYHTLKRGRE